MRTINSPSSQSQYISAATLNPNRPYFTAKKRDDLLRFSDPKTGTCGVSETIPISVAASGTSTFLIAGYSSVGGLYVGSVGVDAYESWINSDLDVSTVSTQITVGDARSLKGSWQGGRYYFASWSWGSSPTIRSSNSSGADLQTVTVTGLPATIKTESGGKFTALVRPSAVLRMASGDTVVVYSCYRYQENLEQMVATLNFYLVKSGQTTAVLLRTIIQYDVADLDLHEDVNVHYRYDPGSSRCEAISRSSGDFFVIASDGTRAMQFQYKNGVESMTEAIIPIDLDANRLQITNPTTGAKTYAQYTTFLPSSATTVAGVYYVSGVMTRTYSNGDFNRMSIYLSSSDGVYWSVGEVSSFIDAKYTEYKNKASASVGNYALCGPVTRLGVSTMYAIASNGYCYSTARERDINSSSDGDEFSEVIVGGSVQGASNSADSVSMNAIEGIDSDILIDDIAGKTISIELGYYDVSGNKHGCKMGEYLVEAEDRVHSSVGRGMSQIAATDIGSWRLTRWSSMTDIDRWSSTMVKDELKAFSKIIVKGISDGYKAIGNATAQGLYLKNINDPMVALTSTRDDRDGMFLMSVEFPDTGNDNKLTSIGLLFGGDDYTDIYTNGKRDRKGFNVYMVPLESTWTEKAKTAPEVRVSNLRRRGDDPDTENVESDKQLAWIWKKRYTSLWERSVYRSSTDPEDDKRMITKAANALGQVYAAANSQLLKNTEYEIVMRKQGSVVQLFARKKSRTPATMVNQEYYEYIRIGEYQFGENNKMSWGPRPFWGFVAGTDTFTTIEGWNSSQYEDIDSTLTEALEEGDYSHWVADGTWDPVNNYSEFDPVSGQTVTKREFAVGPTQWQSSERIAVGQLIRVMTPENSGSWNSFNSWQVVSAVRESGGITYLKFEGDPSRWGDGLGANWNSSTNEGWGVSYAKVYRNWRNSANNAPKYWAKASSGYIAINTLQSNDGTTNLVDNLSVVNVETPVNARKQSRVTAGRGAFVNRDNTAISIRAVESDGTEHRLMSGNSLRQTGFDRTNPVTTSINSYGNFTREWRLMLTQGRLFESGATTFGLPNGNASKQYMIKGDEIVRYMDLSFRSPYSPYVSDTTWCIIPAYYTPIFPSVKGQTWVQQWSKSQNGSWVEPGDGFHTIPSAATNSTLLSGMLVNISGRNGYSFELQDTKHYAISATQPNGGTASTITFSPALQSGRTYMNAEEERAKPDARQSREIAIVSGRQQFGTSSNMNWDDPLCYYPIGTDKVADFDHLIHVNYWQLSAGLYNSAKENIKFVCSLAGIKSTTFQDRSYTIAKNTSLSLTDSSGANIVQSSFVLDLSGVYGGGRSVEVRFRDSYFCRMGVSGSNVTLSLGCLSGFSKAVSAGISGQATLASVTIPVSGHSIEGSHAFRFVAKKERVSVEMDRQPIWTFDLKEYTYEGTLKRDKSLYEEKAGAITVYADSENSLNVTWTELSDEVENQIVDMSMQGSAALQFITAERHIYARTNQNGGLHFSRFLDGNRDVPTAAIPTQNYFQDRLQNNPYSVPGHVLVTGAEYAETIDPSWIRKNGYMFGTNQNRLLDTVEDSVREAKLLMRMAKEDSETSQIAMIGMVHIQPEDQFSKQYTFPPLPGASPDTNEDSVVTAHSVDFGNAVLRSNLQIRRKYPMV